MGPRPHIIGGVRTLCLGLWMIAGLVPGLPSAVEDVLHVVVEGHSMHADVHSEEAEGDQPQGRGDCEGCGHDGLCHCHGSVTFLGADGHPEVRGPLQAGLGAAVTVGVCPARGPEHELERPPRARSRFFGVPA